ncbi:hypothetical protein AVEN_76756-1 [Araneus ventricosus]|uniref:Uncharacterized protein n=1 Tax=Araneus ventricosus TaxID=182803 RepID=A0A4Y2S3L3_ARAVE|nr:hypothetical protein AVEN_76756-1 [Araneus ventricosus]
MTIDKKNHSRDFTLRENSPKFFTDNAKRVNHPRVILRKSEGMAKPRIRWNQATVQNGEAKESDFLTTTVEMRKSGPAWTNLSLMEEAIILCYRGTRLKFVCSAAEESIQF